MSASEKESECSMQSRDNDAPVSDESLAIGSKCKEEKTVNKRKQTDGKLIREEKRQRWLAKQERQNQKKSAEIHRESWIRENSLYSSLVTLDDVRRIKQGSNGSSGKDSSNSSCLATLLNPYFNLQEGKANDLQQMFVAEGTETVRLLIQKSVVSDASQRLPPVQIKSIFVKPSVFFEPPVSLIEDVRKVAKESDSTLQIIGDEDKPQNKSISEESKCAVRPPFRVLIGTEDALSEVAGFPISRGALACGLVPQERDEAWLKTYLLSHKRYKVSEGNRNQNESHTVRLLALDGCSDTANLGSIVRCASAFGIDTLILSHDCCDVWYRRAIRVSMGHVFNVPCIRVNNLPQTIRWLADSPFNITSYASVIDTDAELILHAVKQGSVPHSWCCVMGNEANGISKEVAHACHNRIRIDMMQGVDSLSLPIATGILLNGLKEREGSTSDVYV